MSSPSPDPGTSAAPGASGSDHALVRAALGGCERSVEVVLARLACVVKFVFQLNRKLGYRLSTDSLEDVVQQVYASLWPRLRDFHGGASLEAWAYGFCRNCLRAEARKRRAATWRLLPGGESEVETGGAASVELPEQPEQVAERSERVDALRAALDELPDGEREVVQLRHLEDWSFERIARHLAIAPSTVKDRCYRGMQRLQRSLREFAATNETTGTSGAPSQEAGGA